MPVQVISHRRYILRLIEFKRGFFQVSVPKDTLSRLNVKVDVGLPPDAVYDIVTDPDNKRVFKNIEVS